MSLIDAKNLERFWTQETPSGLINGVNTVYTIAFEPLENESILLFKNGLQQRLGTDFTVSGTTITFASAPAIASDLSVQYIRRTGGN